MLRCATSFLLRMLLNIYLVNILVVHMGVMRLLGHGRSCEEVCVSAHHGDFNTYIETSQGGNLLFFIQRKII